jgi:hypothetical protein
LSVKTVKNFSDMVYLQQDIGRNMTAEKTAQAEAYKQLHDLYSSPDTVRCMKSRRIKWAGDVALLEDTRTT